MTHLKILLKVVLTFHILFSSVQLLAAQKAYELNIENFSANFTGVEVNHALGISQTLPFKKEVSIPAPTLRFKVGDEAVITVYNKTNEPATLHWCRV